MTTVPTARPFIGRVLRGVLLLLALAAAVWVGQRLILGSPIRVVTPERGEVVRTIVASGRVLAPYRVDIGSQITGVVAEIPVAEGQMVERGQALIRLEDAEARAAVRLAEAALAQSQAKLAQITEVGLPVARETVAQAEANLIAAQASFNRVERLKATGFATQAQIDDARKARDVAVAQSRSAHLQLVSNGVGGIERVMAEAAVAQTEATLTSARTKLAYTVIAAPATGVLIARNVERGDVVQPGKTLMTLSPTGETQIVVQIDEKSMGLLAVGQKAFVSADAYPDDRFAAELVYVNPSVDPQTATVQVKLRVATPPAYIRQDMTVSVDIEVARKPDALLLPSTAVHDPMTVRPWVLVVESGRAARRAVKIGLRGDGRLEITEGLAADDRVIPVRAAVDAGDRVRASDGTEVGPKAGQGQKQGSGAGSGTGARRGMGML